MLTSRQRTPSPLKIWSEILVISVFLLRAQRNIQIRRSSAGYLHLVDAPRGLKLEEEQSSDWSRLKTSTNLQLGNNILFKRQPIRVDIANPMALQPPIPTRHITSVIEMEQNCTPGSIKGDCRLATMTV